MQFPLILSVKNSMEELNVKKIWKLLFLLLMLAASVSGCRQKAVQGEKGELVRTGEISPVCCFYIFHRNKIKFVSDYQWQGDSP